MTHSSFPSLHYPRNLDELSQLCANPPIPSSSPFHERISFFSRPLLPEIRSLSSFRFFFSPPAFVLGDPSVLDRRFRPPFTLVDCLLVTVSRRRHWMKFLNLQEPFSIRFFLSPRRRFAASACCTGRQEHDWGHTRGHVSRPSFPPSRFFFVLYTSCLAVDTAHPRAGLFFLLSASILDPPEVAGIPPPPRAVKSSLHCAPIRSFAIPLSKIP